MNIPDKVPDFSKELNANPGKPIKINAMMVVAANVAIQSMIKDVAAITMCAFPDKESMIPLLTSKEKCIEMMREAGTPVDEDTIHKCYTVNKAIIALLELSEVFYPQGVELQK